MRIAVIFHHIGPYHVARMEAAARDAEIIGLEWSADDNFGWGNQDRPPLFQKQSLFPLAKPGTHSAGQLRTALQSALENFKPDVVAVNGWNDFGSLIVIETCNRLRIPMVVMSESTAWDAARSDWKEGIKRRLIDLCSAALVGGSPHQAYLEQLGMAPERIFQGYDAVENGYFSAGAEKSRQWAVESSQEGRDEEKLRNGKNLPERYFLASARFIEKKNLSRLIEAYAKYRKKSIIHHPQSAIWSLVLLGDGELRSALNAQLSTLNLSDHVQMPGFKQYPELPIYYGRAGAFIHASTTEQWGLVVNEAMASGLPVLVSNRCGCAADLVQDGCNGFTFDPENVDQLAALMLELSSLNSQLSTMGSASRAIISHWGPERFAAGLLRAATVAKKLPIPQVGWFDRALLYFLIRR